MRWSGVLVTHKICGQANRDVDNTVERAESRTKRIKNVQGSRIRAELPSGLPYFGNRSWSTRRRFCSIFVVQRWNIFLFMSTRLVRSTPPMCPATFVQTARRTPGSEVGLPSGRSLVPDVSPRRDRAPEPSHISQKVAESQREPSMCLGKTFPLLYQKTDASYAVLVWRGYASFDYKGVHGPSLEFQNTCVPSQFDPMRLGRHVSCCTLAKYMLRSDVLTPYNINIQSAINY